MRKKILVIVWVLTILVVWGEALYGVKIKLLKRLVFSELSEKPFEITENLFFLGEIPRVNNFEGKESIGKVKKNNVYEDDYIIEDSALAFNSDSGIVIITGCSHSGICNITEYAKDICNESKIREIIGGFHLVNARQDKILRTANYLANLEAESFYPCHCTDFQSKMILARHISLGSTGVGLVREYKINYPSF